MEHLINVQLGIIFLNNYQTDKGSELIIKG